MQRIPESHETTTAAAGVEDLAPPSASKQRAQGADVFR